MCPKLSLDITALAYYLISYRGASSGIEIWSQSDQKRRENQKFAFGPLGNLAPPCQAEESASHHVLIQVIHEKHPACLRWLWNVSGSVPHQVSNLHTFIDVGPLFSQKYAMVTTTRIDIALQIKPKHVSGNIWLHEVMSGSDMAA